MYPIQALTQEDKENIVAFYNRYGNCTISIDNLPHTLNYWNKSKGTLFKALGNNLTLSTKSSILLDSCEQYMIDRYNDIYKTPSTYDHISDYGNDFITYFMNYHYKKIHFIGHDSKYYVLSLFSPVLLHSGRTTNFDIYFYKIVKGEEKSCKIVRGTKPMRAIRTLLVKTNFQRMDLFEDWAAKISVLQSQKTEDIEIKLSIHPVDYLTMSTNDNHWSSCTNWDGGCYSNGTVEMMNSNMVMVGYIESKRPFIVQDKQISNKRWRALVYFTKDIIMIGRNYPYYNEYFTKTLLEFAANLAKENLGWDYKYKNQLHRDGMVFCNNKKVRNKSFDFNMNERFITKKKRKSILIYTNGMYNDLLAEPEYSDEFWCYRNKVKKNLYLNASGKMSCAICGKDMDVNHPDDIFSGHGQTKICLDCRKKYLCYDCGHIDATADHYEIIVPHLNYGEYLTSKRVLCDCCIKDYLFIPYFNCAIKKSESHTYKKFLNDYLLPQCKEKQINIYNLEELWTFEQWQRQVHPFELSVFYDYEAKDISLQIQRREEVAEFDRNTVLAQFAT